jgi:hypothetical protein
MAALNRSKSGAYTARKSIPKDVQAEYERLYGQRWEVTDTLKPRRHCSSSLNGLVFRM